MGGFDASGRVVARWALHRRHVSRRSVAALCGGLAWIILATGCGTHSNDDQPAARTDKDGSTTANKGPDRARDTDTGASHAKRSADAGGSHSRKSQRTVVRTINYADRPALLVTFSAPYPEWVTGDGEGWYDVDFESPRAERCWGPVSDWVRGHPVPLNKHDIPGNGRATWLFEPPDHGWCAGVYNAAILYNEVPDWEAPNSTTVVGRFGVDPG